MASLRYAAHPTPAARRRLPAVTAVLGGMLLVATSIGAAFASEPVTVGYRDQSYGGGTFRPTADKPQSKLWFADGLWFAGMFDPATAHFYIYRLDRVTHTWNRTWFNNSAGIVVDQRDKSHGDYLWDGGANTLWVASAHDGKPQAGVSDATRVYRFSYKLDKHTYQLDTGFPKEIPGTNGGKHTVTITRDSTGDLWTVWPDGNQVKYSKSDDGGLNWSSAAQVPGQAGNPIKVDAAGVSTDMASVIAFGNQVGVAWSDHDAIPSAAAGGYYFATIAAGADPTVAGSWTTVKLPTLVPGANPTETADNHINLKAMPDGRVFMVGKTGKDTAGCATNQTLPLIELFDRSTSGTWTAHLVSTVGDCNTRPQVVISDQLDTAFVLLTAPNGGGVTYLKSAPLTGPNAFKFRDGPTSAVERGVPIIKSTSETAIDDPSSTKQLVTDASDIVVLANNLDNTGTTGQKYYLHNEIPIGATDGAPPNGTVSIAAGAATTRTSTVSVAVPATDDASGVAFVRLSNDNAASGGVLTNGKSFPYGTPLNWTLAAGDGARTVYAQWRDGAGNWSAPSPADADSIVVDGTPPTGTVTVNGGAAKTASRSVSLALSASDGTGTGLTNVLISNGSDPATATSVAFAGPTGTYNGWTLPAGDGTKTVSVWYKDVAGNLSPVATDTIALDQTPPTKGTVTINGGANSTASISATIVMAGAGSDATQARASNQSTMAGASSVPASGSASWALAAGRDGIRTVYVQWADALGNWSAPASDTVYLDTVVPVGTVSINGGAAWTKSTAATLSFPGTDTDVTWVRFGTSSNLSAVAYQPWSPGTTKPFTLPSGDGTKTVYAQFKDVGNRQSAVVSDTIGLDTVAPGTTGTPNRRLAGRVTTGIATQIYWTAGSDLRSGVAGYVVQRSIDGGAYLTVARPTAATTSAYFQLSSGKAYRFRVLTKDRAGNNSAWRYTALIRTRNASEASTTIRYRGTWGWISNTAFMGGRARGATAKGASATFTFTGNRVAWLSRTGPTQGTANIYINGTFVTKVNLYSATTTYKQMVFRRSFSTVATRTLKIVVSGSSGKKVVVDGFFVLR